MVADLIGPDVKLHHTKINSKLPGSATAVKWHQDFPFTPHSNDSLITALLMVMKSLSKTVRLKSGLPPMMVKFIRSGMMANSLVL